MKMEGPDCFDFKWSLKENSQKKVAILIKNFKIILERNCAEEILVTVILEHF